MKNLSLAKPTVTWDDICGMEKEKYLLQQNVLMPIILSESRIEVVINSRDILLYGVFNPLPWYFAVFSFEKK